MSKHFRHSLRTGLVLTAAAFLAHVVRADAPLGQYLPFDRDAHCITDSHTNLTWMREPITVATPGVGNLSFDDAPVECAKYGPEWRVPSLNELETLVDDVPHVEGGDLAPKAIDANAFPGTPTVIAYWTSSAVPGASSFGWKVDFGLGLGASLQDTTGASNSVRCVASSVPASCAAGPWPQSVVRRF